MRSLDHLSTWAIGFPATNVDTDQIVPARFLFRSRREGFGDVLFHDLRFDDQGRPRPGFALDQSPEVGAAVLVSGRNFGCGSSREHAVWALLDFGIRCVVAPSFGDIFRSNALKNGLLPIELTEARVESLLERLADGVRAVEVNVPAQTLRFTDDPSDRFEIDPFAKRCLIEGLGEIDVTLRDMDDIADFEERHRQRWPWVFTG